MPLLGLVRCRRHGAAAGIQNQPVRLDPVPVESDSDVADDQQPPESESQSQLVKALKRRLQTAPARAAKALKKVETAAKGVPLESELETSDQSYALRLQRAFFTHNYQRGGYHKPALDPSNDPARHGDDIDGTQKFAESGGESAGSESGFGVAMVNKKVKDSSRSAAPPAKVRKVKEEQPGKKTEKLMSKAKAINATLNSTTALSMWQGTVKQKDLDSRIQKAYGSLSSLAETTGEAKNLHMDLTAGVALAENHANILSAWDMSTVDINKLQNASSDKVTMFATLPSDCLNAMMSDFGKKVIQDITLVGWVEGCHG